VDAAVAAIVADVRARGDAPCSSTPPASTGCGRHVSPTSRLPRPRCAEAFEALPLRNARRSAAAASRVRAYHERQKASSWSFREADGTELGQRVKPLDRVGLYVPGGKAAYPSSVLMNAIPAHVPALPRS